MSWMKRSATSPDPSLGALVSAAGGPDLDRLRELEPEILRYLWTLPATHRRGCTRWLLSGAPHGVSALLAQSSAYVELVRATVREVDPDHYAMVMARRRYRQRGSSHVGTRT